MASDSLLLRLPPSLLAEVFPPSRVVLGLRVCKQLRSDLLGHSRGVVLKVRQGVWAKEGVNFLRVCARDFALWGAHVRVEFECVRLERGFVGNVTAIVEGL
eukprot:100257-Rhodomonas_salina.1